ncbi:glycosyltransferase family 2 protein [Orrella sp. JC864]|uniref:Bactoprenol glycosyltransferase n=2 Tax=Alcaligenaceae TaxID=506 RepID=A0A157SET8_9BORD|nr:MULTISPECIES: glycosyltransferase family 2 protein [Alcaligenaceae]TFL08008.1 glycosyltransferase [Pusillimonas caeni]SAI68958.1 bactoprenol glycosyltransferase [Bordetella ansorpii]SHI52847.1 Glycosyltransferase involved in cell wall bisynthesis [Pollutimonas bauzanensis]
MSPLNRSQATVGISQRLDGQSIPIRLCHSKENPKNIYSRFSYGPNARTVVQRPLVHSVKETILTSTKTPELAETIPNDHSESSSEDKLELSIVLPLRNESEVIVQIYRQLTTVIMPLEIRYELVFVDDGSNDNTIDELSNIARDDPFVVVVVLTRHFGKEAALAAGLAEASGQAVVIMDADLQDPPERIPEMLTAWREGADVVHMRRQHKIASSTLGRLGSRSLHRILDAIGDVGMPESRVDFMLYSRKAVDALSLVVHRKRYMQAMFDWVGASQIVIEYERLPRAAGYSKWCLPTFLGFYPDGTSNYLDAMLRVMMSLGLLGTLTSLLYVCYNIIKATALGSLPEVKPVAMSNQVLFWSVVFFLVGGLGKSISRARFHPKRPQYLVKEVMRFHRPSSL